jgi:hypothetical protein
MPACSSVEARNITPCEIRRKTLWQKQGKGEVDPVIFLTEHHAMKAYWGSGFIAPRIL